MQNVLLIDDELLVVQAMKANVDWDACGVDKVFLCDNVPQALRVLEENPVDLVISDIEMPGMDGIAFAEQLRGSGRDTALIFVTGYAQFEYAKAAVSLKAEDYILKPVDYAKLQEKIIDILAGMRLRRHQKEVQKNWDKRAGNWLEEFTRYVLSNQNEYKGEELLQLTERFRLDFHYDDQFVLFWLRVNERPSWEMQDFIQKTLFEIGAGGDCFSTSFFRDKLLLCMRFPGEVYVDIPGIRRKLSDFVVGLKLSCCGFATDLLVIEQLVPMIHKLAERDAKNVLYQNKLFLIGNRNVIADARRAEVDFGKWELLFAERETERLLQEIDFSIHGVVIAEQMNAEMLQRFYDHLIQMAYRYADGIYNVMDILADEAVARAKQIAVRSVDEFREFARIFLMHIQEERHMCQENDSVELVKRYIEAHLSEKLSRTELAEYAALSENYLSRLFHRETGESISDYIMKRRIATAKKLLVSSNQSVSAIGEQVGYDTTTYFIRIFKREVGKTPKEYRKDMKV